MAALPCKDWCSPGLACLRPNKHTSAPPTSTPVCSDAHHPRTAAPCPGCQAFYHRQKSRWTPWQDEARQAELEEEYRQRLAANHTAGWAPSPRDEASELLARSRHSQRPISTVRQVGQAGPDEHVLRPMLLCSGLVQPTCDAAMLCTRVPPCWCLFHRRALPAPQVLLDTSAAAPRCYRLLVRLVDYQPRDPGEMCHPAAACGLPGTPGLLSQREAGQWRAFRSWPNSKTLLSLSWLA